MEPPVAPSPAPDAPWHPTGGHLDVAVYAFTASGERYDVRPGAGPREGECIAGWADCHCGARGGKAA